MTIYLERFDKAKSGTRFYRLDVQPTLFGDWVLIREWGLIGCEVIIRSTPYSSRNVAETTCDRLMRAKLRCGYQAR